MSAVGRFFGNLFGTEKALEAVVKTTTTMLDEAFYTDQEEAEAVTASRSEARAMVVNWVAATSGSRLARRGLAFAIAGTWLFNHVMSNTMLTVAVFLENTVTVDKLNEASKLIDERSVGMQGAVMLILGFYFAAPYMGDIATTALKQFGSGKRGN